MESKKQEYEFPFEDAYKEIRGILKSIKQKLSLIEDQKTFRRDKNLRNMWLSNQFMEIIIKMAKVVGGPLLKNVIDINTLKNPLNNTRIKDSNIQSKQIRNQPQYKSQRDKSYRRPSSINCLQLEFDSNAIKNLNDQTTIKYNPEQQFMQFKQSLNSRLEKPLEVVQRLDSQRYKQMSKTSRIVKNDPKIFNNILTRFIPKLNQKDKSKLEIQSKVLSKSKNRKANGNSQEVKIHQNIEVMDQVKEGNIDLISRHDNVLLQGAFTLTLKSSNDKVNEILAELVDYNFPAPSNIHPNPNRIFATTFTIDENDKYQGEIDRYTRQPDGRGRRIYSDGQLQEGICGSYYFGEIQNGQRNGKGQYIFSSGSVQEGNFLNSKIEGLGFYWYYNGNYYYGEYVNDKRCGLGIAKYDDGILIGQWKNGQTDGIVMYVPQNGDLIEIRKYEDEQLYETLYSTENTLFQNTECQLT
ncbi:morn repeat protein [Stylonychia lemnae]|uniref:Morn repeat protein n=1 Tax=Stylonychia lemnae TaxID=5949 RepID=A0A078A6W7_STYLE|nr:morn repeat protein [Stylonychia lemnae]|eukprot:CDW77621.1 morn repeat protein [Stylonychia lemnae]